MTMYGMIALVLDKLLYAHYGQKKNYSVNLNTVTKRVGVLTIRNPVFVDTRNNRQTSLSRSTSRRYYNGH